MDERFNDVVKRLEEFRKQRDWEQFHDPKNLAEAISIEASELLEKFLWKNVNESRELPEEKIKDIREEVADIFNFLVYFCLELDIDLFEEVKKKIEKNAKKYPVDKSKGKADKYTEL
jgi:NTP pyrophosphatase (non-canonical NTP hydrolase)